MSEEAILPPPIRTTDEQIIHMQAMQLLCERIQVVHLEKQVKELTEDRDFYQRAFLLLSETRKKDCPYCVWHKDLGRSDDIRSAR